MTHAAKRPIPLWTLAPGLISVAIFVFYLLTEQTEQMYGWFLVVLFPLAGLLAVLQLFVWWWRATHSN